MADIRAVFDACASFVDQLAEKIPAAGVERQLSPLAARADHVQDRVEDFASVDRRPATLPPLRQTRSDQLPLLVREIARIIRAHRCGSVFLDTRFHEGGVVTVFIDSGNLKSPSRGH